MYVHTIMHNWYTRNRTLLLLQGYAPQVRRSPTSPVPLIRHTQWLSARTGASATGRPASAAASRPSRAPPATRVSHVPHILLVNLHARNTFLWFCDCSTAAAFTCPLYLFHTVPTSTHALCSPVLYMYYILCTIYYTLCTLQCRAPTTARGTGVA